MHELNTDSLHHAGLEAAKHLALGNLARALYQMRAVETGADLLEFHELTPPMQQQFVLDALRARDLCDKDIIEEDRKRAIEDFLRGPGQHQPDVEMLAREAIGCFIQRQLKPRPLSVGPHLALYGTVFPLEYDADTDGNGRTVGQWTWTDRVPDCPHCLIPLDNGNGGKVANVDPVTSTREDVVCECCGFRKEIAS